MVEKADIKQHFSDTSDSWDVKVYKSREEQGFFEYFDKQYRFDYVVSMIPTPGDDKKKVLDVGCGAGQLLPILCRLGYDTFGVDISEQMVKLSVDRCRQASVEATVTVEDVEKLNFPDEYFDLYIAMGVIEYMQDDNIMLNEIKRVLKPGGIAIVTMRNHNCFYESWNGFYRGAIRSALINIIRTIKKKPAFVYIPISKRHVPRVFNKQLRTIGFEILGKKYCHFHALPMPLSKFLFPIQALCGKGMETFLSNGIFPFLASSYIVKFRKK